MRLPLVGVFVLAVIGAFGQGTQADYARSESLNQRFSNKVYRISVAPKWLAGGDWLWYRVQVGPQQRDTVVVDIRTGRRELAFDAAKVAEQVGRAIGKTLDPKDLQAQIREVTREAVVVGLEGKWWRVDRKSQKVEPAGVGEATVSTDSLPAFLPPRASGSGEETLITIENRSDKDIKLFWVSTSNERIAYGTLAPGASLVQRTFAGHVWLVTSADNTALAAFEAIEGPCFAIYDGSPVTPTAPRRAREANLSPDGKMRAVVRTDNVWIEPLGGGDAIQVTKDGRSGDTYRGGSLVWSPDGKRLAAIRTEAGGDRKVTFVESSPRDQIQPKVRSFEYLKPGDKVPHERLVLIDIDARQAKAADETLSPNPWDLTRLRWAPDGREIYFVYNERGHQTIRLLAADGVTGKVRTIVEEKSPTFLDYAGKLWVEYLPVSSEALWMSERSGFNHIYLVNLLTGAIKPVTQGSWMVRSVERVDPAKRQLTLRVMGEIPGQDPYHMHYARVGFDGTGLTRLTESDGTHRLTWAPDGETYVATCSRVDMPPRAELRRSRDGKLLSVLEEADIGALKTEGWEAPERFVAKGRDGKTDIYGIIFRPSQFDPTKKYPVIENIYAGPHDFHVPKAFSPTSSSRRMAEIGFVVVQIDGMGTNWRGKAFHDVAWRNLADAGFPDRIAWIKAAAATRPWMDATRVGVYGTSAGGQNAASAVLRFGDFYQAAVADCGCHDNRMDKVWWNELWMGYPVGPWYEANSNVTAAKDLKGKLFLMVGEVDTNVDPASTLQVANALIQAGKEFDLLVAPNVGHGVLGMPYAFRRMQDFFVRHLWKLEPRRG
ncbi:MAG TPA: prolyl oligopeptidase family serine peptidase [Fimbriimonadaceae bacterium]|nr:prolyl oligopeptidase family serine peptidase [Fimbriimonadaceae bacterium]